MPKPRKYRDLVKILRRHDSRFEFWVNRGKGSERIIYHPDVHGRPESFPIKCHGESTEISKGVLSALIRRFSLPKDLL
ncbi:MAG TPA: type II toxin-antitoxin system HicA family toxin [Thermoanaerobaculia bacterium]|nr:type II toxin-antitoxin system HicA family toxin [Thermoanaerobaculia bacterium]